MEDRVDVDFVADEGIHDAVVAFDDLAESRGTYFGDDTAGIRELRKSIRCVHESLYEHGGMVL